MPPSRLLPMLLWLLLHPPLSSQPSAEPTSPSSFEIPFKLQSPSSSSPDDYVYATFAVPAGTTASQAVSLWLSSGALPPSTSPGQLSFFEDAVSSVLLARSSPLPHDACTAPPAHRIFSSLPPRALNLFLPALHEARGEPGGRRGEAGLSLRPAASMKHLPALAAQVSEGVPGKLWVEVGVLGGLFSRFILESMPGDVPKLVMVDLWDEVDIYSGGEGEGNFEKASRSVAPWAGRVDMRRGWSWEVAATLEDGSASFVFVDAGHSFEDVSRDLEAYWGKVAVGGLMAGDDYVDGFVRDAGYTFGVKSAVDAFAARKKHRVYMTTNRDEETGEPLDDVHHQSWYILKCAE